MKKYINNLETGKIELHFSKSEYMELTNEQKTELKSHFLFAKSIPAWVSRGKNNHYWAIQTANKLGFTEEEKTGEKLSFAEELERKAERAENRAERYEEYADNAERRGKALQAEFNNNKKDFSWLTQPIIKGHAGSERFGKQRERIMNRYGKGFEEYRKSEYFQQKAETARETASLQKFDDPAYLHNRIEECNKTIRSLERNIINAEEKQNEQWLESLLEKMEYEIDKLAYLENCMDTAREKLGRPVYSNENIKPGYLVKIRGHWNLVLKANKTTVLVKSSVFELKYPYAEIQEVKIPENWTEPNNEIENPFQVDDIVVATAIGEDRIIRAFQIVKRTDKTVTIRCIKIQNGKPLFNEFVNNVKAERRSVKKDRSGNFVVNADSWYLYKYTEEEQKSVNG